MQKVANISTGRFLARDIFHASLIFLSLLVIGGREAQAQSVPDPALAAPMPPLSAAKKRTMDLPQLIVPVDAKALVQDLGGSVDAGAKTVSLNGRIAAACVSMLGINADGLPLESGLVPFAIVDLAKGAGLECLKKNSKLCADKAEKSCVSFADLYKDPVTKARYHATVGLQSDDPAKLRAGLAMRLSYTNDKKAHLEAAAGCDCDLPSAAVLSPESQPAAEVSKNLQDAFEAVAQAKNSADGAGKKNKRKKCKTDDDDDPDCDDADDDDDSGNKITRFKHVMTDGEIAKAVEEDMQQYYQMAQQNMQSMQNAGMKLQMAIYSAQMNAATSGQNQAGQNQAGQNPYGLGLNLNYPSNYLSSYSPIGAGGFTMPAMGGSAFGGGN